MGDLSIVNATKVFNDGGDEIVAVNDLSVDIEDGEFMVLVGPSGCGKSTTLRMVAGLETPTEGRIELDGREIQDDRPQERDIAMVFQSYALYPHMTVRQNMSFGLEESTNMSDEEIGRRVTEAAEVLDIDELLDRKPGALSGGQQQRVALGRAIVREPEVFLLDEPLSNLDAKLRAQMRTELQRLQEELNVTAMYVTHDQTEAMTMGDRIAILNDGELQQVGTPMQCYHEPANRFVAGFIGEPAMNMIQASNEDGTLVAETFEYILPEDIAAKLEGRTDVVLGARPEDIELVDDPDGEEPVTAFVELVEPHGNENAVQLSFVEGGATELTVTVDGMRSFRSGERVGVRFPEDTIHLFDAASGTALHNRKLTDVDRVEQIGVSQSA
jgi:multiple sugar transport system ATP-binding protein